MAQESYHKKSVRYTQDGLNYFKELYLQGYSGTIICEKMGLKPPRNVGTWVCNMRNKLRLPKRQVRFRKFNPKTFNPENELVKFHKKVVLLQKRQKHIPQILESIEVHKHRLEMELERIPKEIEKISAEYAELCALLPNKGCLEVKKVNV